MTLPRVQALTGGSAKFRFLPVHPQGQCSQQWRVCPCATLYLVISPKRTFAYGSPLVKQSFLPLLTRWSSNSLSWLTKPSHRLFSVFHPTLHSPPPQKTNIELANGDWILDAGSFLSPVVSPADHSTLPVCQRSFKFTIFPPPYTPMQRVWGEISPELLKASGPRPPLTSKGKAVIGA